MRLQGLLVGEESLVPNPKIELTEEFSDGLRWMSISGLMAESPEAPGNRISKKRRRHPY